MIICLLKGNIVGTSRRVIQCLFKSTSPKEELRVEDRGGGQSKRWFPVNLVSGRKVCFSSSALFHLADACKSSLFPAKSLIVFLAEGSRRYADEVRGRCT